MPNTGLSSLSSILSVNARAFIALLQKQRVRLCLFCVTAFLAAFVSPSFAQSSSWALPGAPTAVSASAHDASAQVSFTAPTNTGAGRIRYYTVTSSPGGLTAFGRGSPVIITGLTNGQAYTFTVTATNSFGTGAASSASSAVTPNPVTLSTPTSTADFGSGPATTKASSPQSGWTLTSGLNNGLLSPSGSTATVANPPQTLTDLNIGSGGTMAAEVVPPGGKKAADPDVSVLYVPVFGTYALLINESGGNDLTGKNQNVTIASKTYTVGTGDIDPVDQLIHVKLAISPVVQDPGHSFDQQPYEFVQIQNITTGAIVYTNLNSAGAAGVPWVTTSGSNPVQYINWQMVDWSGGSDQVNIGDQIKVTVVAAGCEPGGHWGRAYICAAPGSLGNSGTGTPGFPIPTVSATGPANATNGQSITYTITYRNPTATAISGATITVAMPQITYVSNVGTGATTTATATYVSTTASHASGISVGGTGSLTVSSVNIPANSYGSFNLVVQVPSGALVTGTLTLGNYIISGTGITSAYGSPVNTQIAGQLYSVTLGYADTQSVNSGTVVTSPSAGSLQYGSTSSVKYVTPGTKVTFNASAYSGQSFKRWSGASSSTSSTLSLTINSNTVLNAAFTPPGPVGGELPYSDPSAGSNDPNYSVSSNGYNVTTAENTAYSGQVEAYSSAGLTLTFTKATNPSHGTVTVNSDGSYTYTPASNYVGNDSFKITVTDSNGLTATITVYVTVGSPPVGGELPYGATGAGTQDPNYDLSSASYKFSVAENHNHSGQVYAYSAGGLTLTYSQNTAPSHGTVTVNSDGSYTYTPTTNYSGSDSFTISATDTTSASATITVNVTVIPPPVAGELPYGSTGAGTQDPNYDLTNNRYAVSTSLNTAYSGQVYAYSSAGLTITYATGSTPSHGTVTVNSDGSYTYTPNTGFYGADTFTVTATDSNSQSVTITVRVTVNAPGPIGGELPYGSTGAGSNDPNYTVASSDYEISMTENSSYSGTVKAYSSAGLTLTFTLATSPSNGTVTVNTDGTYTYTPSSNYSGSDSFTVTVTDSNGATTTITVNVTINSSSGPVGGELPYGSPGAGAYDPNYSTSGNNYQVTTPLNVPYSGQVDAYSSSGYTLTYSGSSSPSHGTVVVNSDGTYTYTPASGYYGTDSFTVLVSDGHGGSTTITVSETVSPKPPTISMATEMNIDAPDSVVVPTTSSASVVVGDPVAGLETLTLSVQSGKISIPSLAGATVVSGSAANVQSMTLSGTLAQLNAALAGLTYTPGSGSGTLWMDTLTGKITSPSGLSAQAQMTINVISQLLGGTSQTFNINSILSQGKTITSEVVTQWDPAVLSQPPAIAPDGTLSFVSVQGQDGSVTKTTFVVKVTYSDGTTAFITVPLTIYHPLLTVMQNVNNPAQLNPQTSLYEQDVQITNTTPFPLVSFSVAVTGLPSGVVLESASGYQANGVPFVAGVAQLAPQAKTVLILEYFSPNAKPFANPTTTLLLSQATSLPNPSGTVTPVQQVVTAYNGRTYVQFPTTSGYTYWIQYRDSASGSWQTSSSPVLGTGLPASWMDYGAPKTNSVPTQARTYQLLVSHP